MKHLSLLLNSVLCRPYLESLSFWSKVRSGWSLAGPHATREIQPKHNIATLDVSFPFASREPIKKTRGAVLPTLPFFLSNARNHYTGRPHLSSSFHTEILALNWINRFTHAQRGRAYILSQPDRTGTAASGRIKREPAGHVRYFDGDELSPISFAHVENDYLLHLRESLSSDNSLTRSPQNIKNWHNLLMYTGAVNSWHVSSAANYADSLSNMKTSEPELFHQSKEHNIPVMTIRSYCSNENCETLSTEDTLIKPVATNSLFTAIGLTAFNTREFHSTQGIIRTDLYLYRNRYFEEDYFGVSPLNLTSEPSFSRPGGGSQNQYSTTHTTRMSPSPSPNPTRYFEHGWDIEKDESLSESTSPVSRTQYHDSDQISYSVNLSFPQGIRKHKRFYEFDVDYTSTHYSTNDSELSVTTSRKSADSTGEDFAFSIVRNITSQSKRFFETDETHSVISGSSRDIDWFTSTPFDHEETLSSMGYDSSRRRFFEDFQHVSSTISLPAPTSAFELVVEEFHATQSWNFTSPPYTSENNEVNRTRSSVRYFSFEDDTSHHNASETGNKDNKFWDCEEDSKDLGCILHNMILRDNCENCTEDMPYQTDVTSDPGLLSRNEVHYTRQIIPQTEDRRTTIRTKITAQANPTQLQSGTDDAKSISELLGVSYSEVDNKKAFEALLDDPELSIIASFIRQHEKFPLLQNLGTSVFIPTNKALEAMPIDVASVAENYILSRRLNELSHGQFFQRELINDIGTIKMKVINDFSPIVMYGLILRAIRPEQLIASRKSLLKSEYRSLQICVEFDESGSQGDANCSKDSSGMSTESVGFDFDVRDDVKPVLKVLGAQVVGIVKCKSSWIYKIDKPLIPEFHAGKPTLMEYIRTNPEYSKIYHMIKSSELFAGWLETAGPITVFLIKDQNWRVGPVEVPPCFFKAIAKPENRGLLNKILKWMTVPGIFTYSDISRHQWLYNAQAPSLQVTHVDHQGWREVQTKIKEFYEVNNRGTQDEGADIIPQYWINSLVEGIKLKTDSTDPLVLIEGKEIIEQDILVSNGIVHAISELPLRPDLDINAFIWDCIHYACNECPIVTKYILRYMDDGGLLPDITNMKAYTIPPGVRPDWVCFGQEQWYPPGWDHADWSAYKRALKRATSRKAQEKMLREGNQRASHNLAKLQDKLTQAEHHLRITHGLYGDPRGYILGKHDDLNKLVGRLLFHRNLDDLPKICSPAPILHRRKHGFLQRSNEDYYDPYLEN